MSDLHRTQALPLLTNIRVLHWHDGNLTSSLSFFGCELRQLHITIPNDTPFTFFIRATSHLAPSLTDISISGDIDPPGNVGLVEPIVGLLRLLSGLRTVNLSLEVDLGLMIPALSELPALLEVELACPNFSIPATPALSNRSFPLIKRLHLGAWGGTSGIPALLDRMAERSSLKSFALGDSNSGCWSKEVGRVVESLRRHEGLRELTINLDVDPISITAQLLRLLGRCSSLEVFELYSEGSLAMTDGELKSSLRNLPKLRKLTLSGSGDIPEPAALSLRSLGITTACCPSMAEIDFSYLDVSGYIAQHSFHASSTLRTVYVGRTRIIDAHSVALFLATLSDADTLSVTSDWGMDTKQGKLWEAVAQWIPILMRAREYERQRWQVSDHVAV